MCAWVRACVRVWVGVRACMRAGGRAGRQACGRAGGPAGSHPWQPFDVILSQWCPLDVLLVTNCRLVIFAVTGVPFCHIDNVPISNYDKH